MSDCKKFSTTDIVLQFQVQLNFKIQFTVHNISGAYMKTDRQAHEYSSKIPTYIHTVHESNS